jgi:hypothetical protein
MVWVRERTIPTERHKIKNALRTHTRDHNASTNADYTNEVTDLDWACETITHNPERLVITWRSADKVLILQDITRISS